MRVWCTSEIVCRCEANHMMKSMLQVTTLMLGVDEKEWFDYLMSWLSQAFCCVDARRQDDTVFQVTALKL